MDIITCSPQLSRSPMPESFVGAYGSAGFWGFAGACTIQGEISTIQDDIAVHVGGYDATFNKFPITMGSPPPRPPV